MSGYIGNIPVPQATQTRNEFTATAGQTTFATSGYTAGFVDVHLNGVKLSSADFTATNGSDIVLGAPAALNDLVEVLAFTTFEVEGLADVASSGDYGDLLNTPSPFDPNTLATVATTGAYSDLTGKPTLGTAAATASTDYATAAQGTLADSAVQANDSPTFGTVTATSFAGDGSALAGIETGTPVASWVDLNNEYTYSFTATHPVGYDTGWLDISTVLTGLPASWRYLAIIEKTVMTSPTTSTYYGRQDGEYAFRLGTSSSSYTEIPLDPFDLTFNGSFMYSASNSSNGWSNTKIGWMMFAAGQNDNAPTSVFQSTFLNSPTIADSSNTYASNSRATNSTTDTKLNFAAQLLPPLGSKNIASQIPYTTENVPDGLGPFIFDGSYDNLAYLGYRFDGDNYGSQNGVAPSFTVKLRASYST